MPIVSDNDWLDELPAEAGWYHLWHPTHGMEMCWVARLQGRREGRYADVYSLLKGPHGTAWMVDTLLAEGCLFRAVPVPAEPRKNRLSKRKPRQQCAKCPFKVTTDPYDIPGGYDPVKHYMLRETIAQGDALEQMANPDPLRLMACHLTTGKRVSLPCVGWLHNQLGEGNNVRLRLRVSDGDVDANYELDGEQHKTFEDTLP